MIISWREINKETLLNIIESFVLREGTDYGEYERTLSEKVEDIQQQLEKGELFIVWSEIHETINIMPKSHFSK